MSPSRTTRITLSNGFTLVELVVVILVLGVLAGVAVPKLLSVGEHANCQAVVTEVQAIFKAVELYAAREGELPADANRRRTPNGLEDFLDPSVLGEATPIGGDYDWQGSTTAFDFIGVTIQEPPSTDAFLAIDQLADDGDLRTGWIRKRNSKLDFWLDSK